MNIMMKMIKKIDGARVLSPVYVSTTHVGDTKHLCQVQHEMGMKGRHI